MNKENKTGEPQRTWEERLHKVMDAIDAAEWDEEVLRVPIFNFVRSLLSSEMEKVCGLLGDEWARKMTKKGQPAYERGYQDGEKGGLTKAIELIRSRIRNK